MKQQETERVVLTKRRCRWCGGEYRAPKGERRIGCPDCAPQLEIGAGRENPPPLSEDEAVRVFGF